MKKMKYLLMAIAFLAMASCSREIPRAVRIDATQLNIQGKTAYVVHADTTAIVLERDSVVNEESGLYDVRTSLTLVLDSTYSTDQLLDTLTLKLQSADGEQLGMLQPADSLIADSLIAFLGKTAGKTKVVAFKGQMAGESILKLQEGGTLSFDGFSFLFADPQASKKLDEYRKHLDALLQIGKEAQQNASRDPFSGFAYAIALGQVLQKTETIDKQLLKMPTRMTPLQRERYNAYHKEMMSYDMRRR